MIDKSDNGLASNRRQAILWTNADPIHWRIYVALWRDELIIYSVKEMFAFAKIAIRFSELLSYLTGVTTADMLRHLSNMNVI